MAEAVRVVAPAKVNLHLAVLGRRADGFHELDTVMLALDWCDTVRVARAPGTNSAGMSLEVHGLAASPDVPVDARNLAWKAADAVWRRGGGVGGLALELEKRVPSQAGLGGGSADAAAAALGAAALLPLAADQRAALVAATLVELGSDCSFFAAAPSGLARCSGRGERVEPLAAWTFPRALCLIASELRSPTSAVYAALGAAPWTEPDGGARPELPAGLFAADLARQRATLYNALEPAALEAVPGLAAVRSWLDRHGAEHFRLSGSGSAFFGLFETPEAASQAAQRLEKAARREGLALRALRVARPAGGARVVRE